MTRVSNTTEEAINNPLIGLMAGLNIEGQERNGQSQLIESTQLPSKNGGHGEKGSAFMQYAKMGIKVISITKGDELFCDVQLPEGWKKRSTSHSMWNELVDNKGRVRATFFYKAAFYDRDAFIHFERRFSFSTITYFTSDEQKGHYEKQKVKVANPNYRKKGEIRDDEQVVWSSDGEFMIESRNGYVRSYAYGNQPKHILEERNIWIPKYKDTYQERNNTPHYYEVTDCGKVIFTTKDDPIYFRRKYTEKNHAKWWKDYEHITKRMRTQAINYLNGLYPDWDNVNAYWD